VEANAELDAALAWLQRADEIGYAIGLYEFSLERAKSSDRDREPGFQQRNWPEVKEGLLNDDPTIKALSEETLATGFQKALALPPARRIPAVQHLAARAGVGATPLTMARALLGGTDIASLETRTRLVEAAPAVFAASTDPAIVFARDLLASLHDQRQRTRILNEKLLRNRSAFARGLAAWKGTTLYPDANFTLRVTYGKVAGYMSHGKPVPFTTNFGDFVALAKARGNTGDFALPKKLQAWVEATSAEPFSRTYASMPVDFVSTNDITGGNSGSATLNRSLEIVGLIFDGNEEAMAGDWTYSEAAGRALSTDIRFALTIARQVHAAGWIVDELMAR
jgi:hypothetical protein